MLLLNCGCWRRLWESSDGRDCPSVPKESTRIPIEGLMLKRSSILGLPDDQPTNWKRPRCWQRLRHKETRVGGVWDGWNWCNDITRANCSDYRSPHAATAGNKKSWDMISTTEQQWNTRDSKVMLRFFCFRKCSVRPAQYREIWNSLEQKYNSLVAKVK